ncbi:GNAT family N-acetyltransferase [Lysobacter niastensis]|uniref:GNAT family N-acetyltransferase n=1 Tax=Lysobacter niastensis TaxID=380629 RepID=A0ABS0B606_9GAMM|nr:GNAT family N-acetyltransferase [Lysobacter niastensis]MBF6023643.1 GNAT family N-acetyltransferase [Lysobacter niastensis]
MDTSALTIRCCSGTAIEPHLEDIARLRIAVFRDWPYLYEGDAGYEAQYLRTYVDSPRSVVVLAQAGYDTGQVFYCGESVLLPRYRGLGLGHRFFDEREAHARALGGFRWTSFCAVDRSDDDPRRPSAHRGNEAFWHKRGYRRAANLSMSLPWNEVGGGEVMHTLTYWLRPLEDML